MSPDDPDTGVDVDVAPEETAPPPADEFTEGGDEGVTEFVQEKPASTGLFLKILLVIAALGAGGYFFLKMQPKPEMVHLGPPPQMVQKPMPVPVPMPDSSVLKAVNAPPQTQPAEKAAPAAVAVSSGLPAPSIIPPVQPQPATKKAEDLMPPPLAIPAPPSKAEKKVSAAEAMMPAMPAVPVPPVAKEISAAPALPLPAKPAVLPPPENAEKTNEEKANLEKTGADLAAAQDKIKALEQKISDLEKTIEDMQATAPEEKTVPKKAAARKSTLRHAKKRARVIHLRRPKTRKPEWVLRGAKPGMAWVALPGSDELRTVAVGDVLPGIGRVTSVMRDSAGHWTLSGTQGRLSSK